MKPIGILFQIYKNGYDWYRNINIIHLSSLSRKTDFLRLIYYRSISSRPDKRFFQIFASIFFIYLNLNMCLQTTIYYPDCGHSFNKSQSRKCKCPEAEEFKDVLEGICEPCRRSGSSPWGSVNPKKGAIKQDSSPTQRLSDGAWKDDGRKTYNGREIALQSQSGRSSGGWSQSDHGKRRWIDKLKAADSTTTSNTSWPFNPVHQNR